MKTTWLHTILLFLLPVLMFSQIEPLTKNKEQKVGEPFVVRYELPSKVNWTLPSLKKRSIISKNLEVLSTKLDTISDKTQFELELIAFDSGFYTLPSYTFKNTQQELKSFKKDVHVSRVKVNTLQKPIYDIKPIKDISLTSNDYFNKYRWILIGVLATLFTLIIGFLVYYIIKNKTFSKKEKPEVPPGEEALKALTDLKKQQIWVENTKEYYSQLTDILRHYFDRKLKFDALESTSDEILQEIKPQLEKTEHEALQNLLFEADLVKFAKSTPSESKHLNYLSESVKLVQTLEERIVEETPEEEIQTLAEIKTTYFDFIGSHQKQLTPGDYALWWKTNSEDHFNPSVSKKVWDLFYEEYLPYSSFITGLLLSEKGLNPQKEEYIFLSSEQIFAFKNESVGNYLITLSKSKGILLLLNTNECSREMRDTFLLQFITHVEKLIQNELNPIQQKEYKTNSSSAEANDWYNFVKGMLIKAEKKGDEIKKIEGKTIS